MRTLLTTLLLIAPFICKGQNEHIIITPEQATQIKGNYGIYSAIEPVPTPDGRFIVPERCLTDEDLTDARITLQIIKSNAVTQNITELPEIGQPVYKDSLYKSDEGLVKCVQTHNMTIYKPSEVPALFSFFRENSDDLLWIPNEQVKLGWKRMYNGMQYECIQSHMTLEAWTPTATLGVLWKAIVTTSEWVAGVSYKVGDIVTYYGSTYRCLQAHTSISTWYPSIVPSLWAKQ